MKLRDQNKPGAQASKVLAFTRNRMNFLAMGLFFLLTGAFLTSVFRLPYIPKHKIKAHMHYARGLLYPSQFFIPLQ